MRRRKFRRRVPTTVTLAVVIATLCGTTWWAHSEYTQAKNRRHFYALTKYSPWPWRELSVPDDLPEEDEDTLLSASVGDLGFRVTFPATTPDGHEIMVKYRIHNPLDDGYLPYGPHCGATRIRTCTPLGDGITKVVTYDTFNSNPSLALYQNRGGRLFSITGYDGPANVNQLHRLLTRTHRPTDDELLHLLRDPGYEIDWWLP